MKNKGIFKLAVFISMAALASLSCGVSDIGGIFATETPTPTSTFTPTPTFTPSPTPTSTPTSTPTATPLPTGVTSEEQADGSTLLVDYDNKYHLLLPVDWMAIPLTADDMAQAMQQAGKEDPDFVEMAQAFQEMDPDIIRLIGLNANRKYSGASFPTLLTITAFSDAIASTMPMAFVTAMIEDNILTGASNLSWDVINNENGVEVGVVNGIKTITAPNGLKVVVAERVIAFQTKDKLIIIDVVTPKEYGDDVFLPFEGIIDSIKTSLP